LDEVLYRIIPFTGLVGRSDDVPDGSTIAPEPEQRIKLLADEKNKVPVVSPVITPALAEMFPARMVLIMVMF
jgi:hypothetical protein